MRYDNTTGAVKMFRIFDQNTLLYLCIIIWLPTVPIFYNELREKEDPAGKISDFSKE
jgi:hypothetical protein